MKSRCTKNDVGIHALKPLTKAIYQAITIQPDLPKAAGGLLLIGCMGFHHTASAINVSELNGSNGFAVTGNEIGSVQSIGDVNADGNADFITGNAIVFGRSDNSFPASLNTSQLNGSNGFKVDGGYRASADINGDGITDLAFFNHTSSPTEAMVVFGRDTAVDGPFPATIAGSDLDGSNGFRINPPANGAEFGNLSAPGDISGDGIDDLALLSSRNSSYQYQSFIHVVFGEDTPNAFPADFPLGGINGTNGFRMTINLNLDEHISLVDSKIDYNGDSFDDILIQGGYSPLPYGTHSSASVILASKLGNNGVFPPSVDITYNSDVRISAGGFYISYGSAEVNIAGDLDNDGTGDVFVCCGTYDGEASIAFGAVESTGQRPGEKIVSMGLNIGNAQSIGDINSDGIDDLLLGGGHPYRAYPSDLRAKHHIVFGRDVALQGDFPSNIDASFFNGQDGFTITDDEFILGKYDSQIAALNSGDINNDGIQDVVIGVPRHDSPADSAGRTYVIYGRDTQFPADTLTSELNSSQGFTIDGVSADHNVGATVAVADINNDGLDDVILSSAIDTYVVLGSGTQSSDPIASCPGDVDGNGEPDLAVLSQANGRLSAVIKDINGNQVSSVNFTNTGAAVDMEVMADINNNGSPELVVLGENPATGEVRDSFTGQLLGSVNFNSANKPIDLELVADQDSNTIPELANLNEGSQVQIKDPLSGNLINNVQFNTNFTPTDLSILDRTPPRLAVLMDKAQANKTDKIEVRHMQTGAVLKNIWYGKGWEMAQLELLSDINGNNRQEAAVLREKTNKFNVMIRDSQSGASLGVLGYDSNYGPIKMAVSADLNNNGSDEIVVLDEHKQNGAIKASVKDSKNKKLIKKMFFNKNLIPHDLVICPDINGNNKSEVVVLGERENNGELVLVVKDAKTGRLIGTVGF